MVHDKETANKAEETGAAHHLPESSEAKVKEEK